MLSSQKTPASVPPAPLLPPAAGVCDAEVPATVSYIATEPEYTPPVIYSNETRAKLVFMVEARPSVENASRLRPGQPVTITMK